MEKELQEVMGEEMVNELEEVNKKPSKGAVLGIAVAAVAGVLFAFRKKINAKIEGSMVKKLSKKGYTIIKPELGETISEKVLEAFE